MFRRERVLKRSRVVACLFASLLLSACAPVWKKPEVMLGKIELGGGTILDQRPKLKLKVRNPNDRDIPVEKLRFELLVASMSYASGQSDVPVSIPRRGEATLDLDASLQLARLLGNLASLKGEDDRLNYRLKGEVVVQGFGAVPFDHPGSLDIASLKRLFSR